MARRELEPTDVREDRMAEPKTEPPSRGEADREEVESVVHRITTPDDEQLALTRLQSSDATTEDSPIVLVHGTYTDRTFWMTSDGFGLGPFLARRGFDVRIPELRGHGRSPKGDGFERWTAEDHIRLDLPSVHETVIAEGDGSPVWVGHSAGGLYLLGALARTWIDPDEVQAVAVFGTQISEGEAYLKNRFVAGTVKAAIDLVGRFPAPLLGMGPEVEPPGEMAELIGWKAEGRWTDSSGRSYWDGLAELELPFRAYAGAGDETDPPVGCEQLFREVGSDRKSYQLLSKDEGFSRDYGHAEMIASRAASQDVWPDLLEWLTEHA